MGHIHITMLPIHIILTLLFWDVGKKNSSGFYNFFSIDVNVDFAMPILRRSCCTRFYYNSIWKKIMFNKCQRVDWIVNLRQLHRKEKINNDIVDNFQSAYKAGHSCETALLRVYNEKYVGICGNALKLIKSYFLIVLNVLKWMMLYQMLLILFVVFHGDRF